MAIKTTQPCRACERHDLEVFLDLGWSPIANRLLTREQLNQPEPTYPLEVAFCLHCSLVQILETIPPEVIFSKDYPYYSSFSPALLNHSRENVIDLINSRNLNAYSHIVELASNDGYLLKNYVEHGIPCLGIDPAEGPAAVANQAGVPTLCEFFGASLAKQLKSEGKSADIIHANNVLAHVAGMHDFVEGIRVLLKDDGMAVIEVPYVLDLIDHGEFDTIYHEHLCYFSVTALDFLFRQHDLFLCKVKRIPIHGGSLRLYFGKKEAIDESVFSIQEDERALKIDQAGYYKNFAILTASIKKALSSLLSALKKQGKIIAAYGAAAKGVTLMNYVGIGKETIDFVVDRNTHKQGLYMPGNQIPIVSPEKLVQEMPDYVLMLTWNFADEILKQQEAYRLRGGKFLLPMPTPQIV